MVRWNGPYEVTEVPTDYTRKVRLLGATKEYLVHIQRIKRFASHDVGKLQKLQEAAQHDAQEFEIESVQGWRLQDGDIQIKIRWLGFEEPDDTWEPLMQIAESLPTTASDYLRAHQDEHPKLEAALKSMD